MTKADLEKRPSQVSAMFDRVSTHYDRTNDVLSLGAAPLWRRQTRLAVKARPGERVLDVAAGTGTMSALFAEDGAKVTALDFSHGMLEEGVRRHGGDAGITFVHGDATQLPFEDGTFDATTISFGLRNVQQPKLALAEMRRVTKPGGRIVVSEFSTVTNPVVRVGYDVYMATLMPLVVRLVSSDPEAYEYLHETIQAWPDQPTLAAWLRGAGFERVKYRNLSSGIAALHKGFVPTGA
ncbi:class I SAM-dependent methyltransferase [Pseudoclavibacter chungangensis]|uniref:Demethylmenaquinone methyltransferase n=1 Tax=Pseudoclavibacter chungangensis TaxID=587635 RepID=A0A7J5BQV9_9MICO|nr:class I SAM-dependent methyltransferase [Pseudoclavibacter chungangensis]KAB1656665.1 class I SAM-dependent methyltransferase [Pseudoclavibacter chungangensis]NYJ67884.1 demethylmenaquinone methyltransferase/2-methoxy-6-polyprenyl-1,4-benzoquinol methylase [Pseudoclavibacter chungangensis]